LLQGRARISIGWSTLQVCDGNMGVPEMLGTSPCEITATTVTLREEFTCATYCHGTSARRKHAVAARHGAKKWSHSSPDLKMNSLPTPSLTGSKCSIQNPTPWLLDPAQRFVAVSITRVASLLPGSGGSGSKTVS